MDKEKKQLIKEYIPILLSMNNILEIDSYVRKLSIVTGYEIESINNLLIDARRMGLKEREKVIEKYQPEKKMLQKLQIAERELLYLMTNHKEAVEFYENNVTGFYEDIYREIANYAIEYASKHDTMSVNGIISQINESEPANEEALINELTALQYEDNHINIVKDDNGEDTLNIEEVLSSLLTSINSEKEKINEDDVLKQSLVGKSPLEQARIINDYTRRKAKKSEE